MLQQTGRFAPLRTFAAISLVLIVFFVYQTWHDSIWTYAPISPELDTSPELDASPELDTTPQDPSNPRYAFATFLAGTADESSRLADSEDGYFISTRVLLYKLLHSPPTRVRRGIDVLVLVSPFIPFSQRDRLTADGALVVEVEPLMANWTNHPLQDRWAQTFSKLHIFEQTQYERVCFIDADHMIVKPLDGVFDDAAAEPRQPKSQAEALKKDESPLPEWYVYAGKPDAQSYGHSYPLQENDYLNAGFFVGAPGKEIFEYYMSVLSAEDRFDAAWMDQALFNYAHRVEGNMPWQHLSPIWNINWPTKNDLDAGVASLHDKFWPGGNDGADSVLLNLWEGQKSEMEGFWLGVDAAMAGEVLI